MAKPFNITPRQAGILAAIVKENCETGNPISSKELVEKNYLNSSGATIRNEMRVLERAGLIYQPHTSSGRLPTDAGYRYFISQLMEHARMSGREQIRLRKELQKLQHQHYELARSISKLLAETSKAGAFTLLPGASSAAGFSNIVSEDLGPKQLKSVAGFFDNLDKGRRVLAKADLRQVQTYIGSEAPIPLSEDVSMMVTAVRLPGGQRGVVGIVGSKRMKYAKNISLLEYVSKLISGGGAAMVIMFLVR